MTVILAAFVCVGMWARRSEAYRRFVDQDIEIYWGAYLGLPNEILVSGKLRDVAEEIQQARTAARAANGWIMDTYLMRKN